MSAAKDLVATLRRIADSGRWVSIGSIDSHKKIQLSRRQVDDLRDAADRLEDREARVLSLNDQLITEQRMREAEWREAHVLERIGEYQRRAEEAESKAKHWKGNHDNAVRNIRRLRGVHQLKRILTKGDVTVTETYVVTPYLVRIDSNDPRQGTVIGQVTDPKTFLAEGAPPWVDKVEVTEEWIERIEL